VRGPAPRFFCYRESWRSLRALEQVAVVCEVAGAAAVKAGTVVARVPPAEAAGECGCTAGR
jgi:hypothetical protein